MKLLLIDPGWDHTSYLVRELARAGFQVTLATPLAAERRFLAKYCTQVVAPWSGAGPQAFGELISASDADVVLPLSEDIMDALWQLPESLTERVFPHTTPLQRELLGDRTRMYAFAAAQGLPVPGMMELAGEADFVRAFDQMGSPLVLRGTQGLAGLQVMIVDRTQASEAYVEMRKRSPGAPFAQEYIVGRRCLVGGLFHGGQALQMFSQTTLESIRPPTGPSIRVMSVQDPQLMQHVRNLFQGFGWDGLACAEFMQGADGKYRFLEINPRPWAAIYAAHCCGVPLLRSFAQYLQGDHSIRPSEFRAGREVVLFPQYLSTRIASGQFPRFRDVPDYLLALKGAPWGSPALLMHMLRRCFWSRRA